MEPLHFQPSAPFTVGVEVEFQLLRSASLDLAPMAPALLDNVPDRLQGQIKPEFIQSMIELSTKVCQDIRAVEHDLGLLCKTAETLARKLDCVIFAASLHPFALVRERHVSPGVRYGEILADLQLAGRRMVTQALHVHIGLPDAETAIRVCNGIRPYLPILLALTTSSPFLEGEDTGFHSYRTNLFKALPRSGIPEALESFAKFQELILVLNEATILNGIKELWWDVRPHPDFGTVEIRICDLPSRFDEILAMAALIQALTATLTDQEPLNMPPLEIMLHNKWHAARYGLDGTFINAVSGKHPTFADAARALFELVRHKAEHLGASAYFGPFARILEHKTSADRQRRLYAETGDFAVVIDTLRREFWQ